MDHRETEKVKAQEWIVQFNGKIKRTEKVLYLDSSNNIVKNKS